MPVLLVASMLSFEQKIYRGIFDALYPHKSVRVWVDDSLKRRFFEKLGPRIELVDDRKKADLLILFFTKDDKSGKPVVVGRHALLQRYKERCVVGFYWKKGRPHLIFCRPNLRRFGLPVPEAYDKYMVDRL